MMGAGESPAPFFLFMPNYDSYNYNTMGFGNDPFANREGGNPVGDAGLDVNNALSNGLFGSNGVLGFADDAVGTMLFGDPDASSKIMGELTGYNKQQREFAYQEYMQEKQWAYDDPSAQMARMARAGINLNTAAAGVAGGNISAGAPTPGSGASPAAGAGAVTDFASMLNQGHLSAAEAHNQEAQANKTNTETPFVPILAHGQNMKYFGDLIQSFKDVGIGEIYAGGIAFDMLNGGLQKGIQYLGALSGLRNIDTEMKRIKNEIALQEKDLESYDLRLNSSLSLQEKQGLQAAAAAAKMKLEAYRQQQMNNLEDKVPGLTFLSDGKLLFNTAWNYGFDSDIYKKLEESIYRFNYNLARGGYDARVDTIYDESYNQFKGQFDVKADFAEFESLIRQNETWIKGYVDFLLNSKVSNPVGMITQLFNTIHAVSLGRESQESMSFGISPALRYNAKPDKGGLPHFRDMNH